MTQTLERHIHSQISPESASPEHTRRGDMLAGVFRVLDAARVRWCIPHGHESLPGQVGSDVDLIVDRSVLPHKLAHLLDENAMAIGGEIVQWLADGAHFIVIADRSGPTPVLLQLHITPDFEQSSRVFYKGDELLSARQREDRLWTLPEHLEFGCILCNRLAKGSIDDQRGRRLSALYQQSPLACERQVSRFFKPAAAVNICLAAQSGNWSSVRAELPALRAHMLERVRRRDRLGVLTRRFRSLGRRVARWSKPPCGVHVVFLGPDGVGKSTVIAAVQEDLAPAFLKTEYHTFAPSLLPAKMQQKPSPHAKPPRGKIASLYKAGWWTVCYTVGYMLTIHPARARSAFVLNHRYLLDAIVDRKRYRYSGPIWILKLIAKISPSADLVLLLDAPPETIWLRKKEVTLEETTRQEREYRAVVEPLSNGHVVDASVAVTDTIAAAEKIILDFMRQRIVRRFGLSGANSKAA